ncbi:MAG: response regulator, partial [Bacteroidota bacterium]
LLLSKSLGKPGYKILKATDGMQALNMVSEENPHLIILDMQMPVMDGISFLKLFRKRNLSTPILALSAMPEETIYSEALRLGVVDFLKKPFELSFLLYKVKKVLGKSTN